jgi:hypothetical protein
MNKHALLFFSTLSFGNDKKIHGFSSISIEVGWFRFMAFIATFNNISAISWRSVFLVEEAGENHRPVASH